MSLILQREQNSFGNGQILEKNGKRLEKGIYNYIT